MDLLLQLQQKQVLSQKQQQAVEILQMNALALSEYVRETTEENPLLEWSEDDAPEKQKGKLLEWLEETDVENRGFYRVEHETKEEEQFGSKEAESLREYLLFQISLLKIPEGHKTVLRFLAESTAESGYLEADAVEMMMEKFPMKESTAARILTQFQSLDPVGVGARDLRECLLIQLRQKNASALAFDIAGNYLDALAKNRLTYIAKKLKVTTEEVTEALQEIRACQPKPGSGFVGEGKVEYVIPDVFVEHRDGEWIVTCNSSVIPHLNISHAYVQMLRSGANAETEAYISEKLKQAEWILQCISRRESTLQQVSECIVRRQEAFFASHDRLIPLRMVDVAEELGIHESTVSRTVKEKYLQCERGIFPLHDFFSTALTKEGDGTVSSDSIKDRLKTLIAQEDKKKPLSDRELTDKLTAEGIGISRRTVAKYREAMGIAGASGRKAY